MAPTVEVSQLDPFTAAKLLAGMDRFDPTGAATPHDVEHDAARGLAFAATHAESGSQAVYVLQVHNGQCRILWCKGEGAVDWTRTLLPAIELQASELQSVAFQTARPGLVRQARKQGYRVTGWILRKDLQR
jgi:hypothetical protein